MAHHSHADLSTEVTRMRPAGKSLGPILMAGGLVAVIVAYFVAPHDDDGHFRRFWFAYLFGLAAITAVSCASLVFTIVNHLVRAGWITNVRRILETFALQMILVLILTLPIIGLVLGKHGTVYSWAKPTDTPVIHHHEGGEHGGTGDESTEPGPGSHEATAAGQAGQDNHKPADRPAAVGEAHAEAAATGSPEAGARVPGNDVADQTKQAEHNDPTIKHENDDVISYPNEQVRPGVQRDFDEIVAQKNHTWLNPTFWALRIFVYLALLSGFAWWYWSSSVKQDATGDIDITARLSYAAGPLLAITGLITTFIAFDVFMSLDPHWFSTMYGLYFFASGTQAMWALIALFVLTLQSRGYLKQSVTQEHRHDVGKFLWAFIFFWGYIAFSQYMLQWYANLPEETFFFDKRGYSQAHPNGYTGLAVALLIGRFIVPFLGLLSRHVKRNRFGLGFWSAWLLVFFVIDTYLLVLPEYKFIAPGHLPLMGLTEILAFVGIAGLWLGNVLRVLGNHELRPVRDPRVHESVALQNF